MFDIDIIVLFSDKHYAWLQMGSCRKRNVSNDEPSTSSSTTSETVRKPSSSSSAMAKKTKAYFRKYNPDFLKFGFVCSGSEEEPLP